MGNITCEMPDVNPLEEEIKDILNESKIIAIVGMSDKEDRDSFKVGKYLKDNGYRIIPVNPAKDEILGEKCYPDLKSIPEKVDIVDIFRKMEAVPAVVDAAIAIDAKTIWLQLGLAHKVSADKVRAAGKKMVQSKCTKIEHQKLNNSGSEIKFNLNT